jgi:hydroxymethylbilane synthase
VVVALAGLRRLGRADEASEILDAERMLPAPAQGALAVECRADDEQAQATLAALDDPASRAAVDAERAVLTALQAGCSAPIGALAHVLATTLVLRGSVTAADGSAAVHRETTGPTTTAADLGRRLAADLLAGGAASMMGSTA